MDNNYEGSVYKFNCKDCDNLLFRKIIEKFKVRHGEDCRTFRNGKSDCNYANNLLAGYRMFDFKTEILHFTNKTLKADFDKTLKLTNAIIEVTFSKNKI